MITIGLSGGAALRQIVSAVERRAVSGDGAVESAVNEAAVFIDAGMHQDDVARLHARRQGVGVIGLIGPHEIRGQQSSECGFLLGSFVAERVNVIDVAAGGRLRLLARARDHGLLRFAFDAVGIGKNEMAFVFGAGLEIEQAAREHVGRDEAVVMLAAFARRAAEHLLVLQTEKREALPPLLLAFLAIGDVDARVAIVVA